ncbi:MAG TPA: ABC transporter ATP-binding protein [Rubricoccaceae bacterium]|jgi:heme exporter protein A
MRYGRRRLFEGLTVEVEPGAPLAVVGPNGSGKSTLLLVLAGVVAPTAGAVRLTVDGRGVPDDERPLRVGLVAPSLQLYEPLTARENLTFLARARGLADAAVRVDGALDRVGLLARADEPLATFSTGMRQRMRLAAAVLHRPAVLLLDEPGATLDAEGRALVAALIAEPGPVVVVATNDPDEAALCPRRLTLAAG